MTPDDPFPPEDFDAWAGSYDQDTRSGAFPFTGYPQVLDTVVALSGAQPGESVLDLGAGTGSLALRFADLGCELYLTDFSQAMLDLARSRLPGARFVIHDLRAPWPPELDRRFHHIVSAYVFHHFELPDKVRIVRSLLDERLLPGGTLVIADLSFPHQAALEGVRAGSGELWEEEPYWIASQALPALEAASVRAEYIQVSDCAGVYRLEKVEP